MKGERISIGIYSEIERGKSRVEKAKKPNGGEFRRKMEERGS